MNTINLFQHRKNVTIIPTDFFPFSSFVNQSSNQQHLQADIFIYILFPFSLRLAPSISIMIYLRSPVKISLRTSGHFRPDFLTVFYILSTISFRFPCIFFNYDLLTNMCYGLPVNVFKGKNRFRTPWRITGCPGHLVRNVFVPPFQWTVHSVANWITLARKQLETCGFQFWIEGQ